MDSFDEFVAEDSPTNEDDVIALCNLVEEYKLQVDSLSKELCASSIREKVNLALFTNNFMKQNALKFFVFFRVFKSSMKNYSLLNENMRCTLENWKVL